MIRTDLRGMHRANRHDANVAVRNREPRALGAIDGDDAMAREHRCVPATIGRECREDVLTRRIRVRGRVRRFLEDARHVEQVIVVRVTGDDRADLVEFDAGKSCVDGCYIRRQRHVERDFDGRLPREQRRRDHGFVIVADNKALDAQRSDLQWRFDNDGITRVNDRASGFASNVGLEQAQSKAQIAVLIAAQYGDAFARQVAGFCYTSVSDACEAFDDARRELLLQRGWISRESIARALADQKRTKLRLCSQLVANGALDQDKAAQVLGELHRSAAAMKRHLDGRDESLASLIAGDSARDLCRDSDRPHEQRRIDRLRARTVAGAARQARVDARRRARARGRPRIDGRGADRCSVELDIPIDIDEPPAAEEEDARAIGRDSRHGRAGRARFARCNARRVSRDR